MGFRFSKVQGPTDSVAATKTQVGSTYTVPPKGPYHIHELIVSKGNVVDAKQCSGLITVEVSGVDGTYIYAYGNGAGGATNSILFAGEKIQCRIPAPSGAEVKIYVTDAEIAKDVTVSAAFWSGIQRVDSYVWGDANQDTTADTALALATAPKITKAGKIRQIRFAGAGVTNAKAGSGKLVIDVPSNGFPQEFAVGNGAGGAANSGGSFADVIGDLDKKDLEIGGEGNGIIPVNTTIAAELTTAEVMLSVYCSIQVA